MKIEYIVQSAQSEGISVSGLRKYGHLWGEPYSQYKQLVPDDNSGTHLVE